MFGNFTVGFSDIFIFRTVAAHEISSSLVNFQFGGPTWADLTVVVHIRIWSRFGPKTPTCGVYVFLSNRGPGGLPQG